jgi:hypothetical protein
MAPRDAGQRIGMVAEPRVRRARPRRHRDHRDGGKTGTHRTDDRDRTRVHDAYLAEKLEMEDASAAVEERSSGGSAGGAELARPRI